MDEHEIGTVKTRISGPGARALAIVARKARAFCGAVVGMLILFCVAGTTAFSDAKPGDPPIYNPASKSYFQLLKLTTEKRSWRFAHSAAMSRIFKGVRGRLAVIDRPETHQFILQNFEVKHQIWIGLRYWCRYRMLEWNGLRPYSPREPGRFHAWHPQWYVSTQTWQVCEASGTAVPYMAVYYEPQGEGNARWRAAGTVKNFGHFLVEYPTGEE